MEAVLDEVECSSREYLVLLQCVYRTVIRDTCNDGNDVTVDCCKLGERGRDGGREGGREGGKMPKRGKDMKDMVSVSVS